ncbi:hypothetical protein GCM10010121_088830 [Streptomyces brasiliensis]|uniref:Uncharacterized protein n=1 Tax=Streptomyces brasiliensis TaxID=1954 RepID=A0A917UKP9_9ACTN|nr:hypothetical protein GCM10010121_088830 [Streptomyces brasiliensis]
MCGGCSVRCVVDGGTRWASVLATVAAAAAARVPVALCVAKVPCVPGAFGLAAVLDLDFEKRRWATGMGGAGVVRGATGRGATGRGATGRGEWVVDVVAGDGERRGAAGVGLVGAAGVAAAVRGEASAGAVVTGAPRGEAVGRVRWRAGASDGELLWVAGRAVDAGADGRAAAVGFGATGCETSGAPRPRRGAWVLRCTGVGLGVGMFGECGGGGGDGARR